MKAWLNATFEGGRHERRVKKIDTDEIRREPPDLRTVMPQHDSSVKASRRSRCLQEIRDIDPEIARFIDSRSSGSGNGLELIASENFVSPAVLEAMGTPLTNKYAEGLPGSATTAAASSSIMVEQLAIDRVKQLFGADHANVQPHSGAQANAAVVSRRSLKPGDVVLGLDLSQGGHLTHGSPVNFSGTSVPRDVATASAKTTVASTTTACSEIAREAERRR